MKLTNKLRLPEPIVKAVSNDSYTKGDADISVTEMLSPAWMRQLKLKHASELEEDVSERIWSLLGSAVHHIIERASDQDDVLSEATIYMEAGGWKIKGQADHITLSRAELCDFKVTTAWKILGGRVPDEWAQQTNIYRRMLQKEKGIQVNSIAIIVILRDWSKREASRREDYPQAQVVRLDVPLWSADETDAFVLERIRHHQDPEPEPCTDAEIWAKPSKWAVMQKGRKTAVRLYDSADEAGLAVVRADYYVEYRPGIATRCESYCPVAQFCDQFQNDPRRKDTPEMENLFNA